MGTNYEIQKANYLRKKKVAMHLLSDIEEYGEIIENYIVETLSHEELPFWERWFKWANSNEVKNEINNNMEILVLFETDGHGTYASYKFLGVFDDIEKVVKAMEVNHQAHPEHCEQIRHSTTTLTGHGFEFILQRRLLNETF